MDDLLRLVQGLVARDRYRNTTDAVLHLTEEVGELAKALRNGEGPNLGEEATDCFLGALIVLFRAGWEPSEIRELALKKCQKWESKYINK